MEANSLDNIINNVACIYGYVVNKETYDIKHLNSHLANYLGYKDGDTSFIGQKCYRTIYNSRRPCEFCNMHVIKLGETRRWYRNLKIEKKHVAMKDSLLEIDNNVCFVGSIYDITEEVSQMVNVQNIANLDRAVKSCTRVLAEGTDAKASNEKLLKIVSEFYSSDSAYIYEYNNDENNFTLSNTHYSNKTSHKVSKQISFDDDTSNELVNNEYVALNRYDHGDNEFFQALAGNDMHDLLLAPIKTDDIISGIIGINNYDDDITNFELMSMVSSFVSNNISMDSTQNALNSTLSTMEDVIGSNRVMVNCVKALVDDEGSSNSTSSITHLLEEIQRYYDCDRAYMFECDMTNLYIKNINEVLKRDVSSCVPTLKSLTFENLTPWFEYLYENSHIILNDCKTTIDSTTSNYKLIIKNNVNSIMMIPLYRDNILCGIIAVENINQNADDISLLKSVSSFVVSHINKVAIVKNLEELSFNDELTGLYNRNFYISYVEQLTKQTHKKMGIIFADVNGLKQANDNFGHEFGDVLIKWCANFLRKNTGSLMFRVGGDELICFFENVTSMEFDFCIRRLQYELNKLDRSLISFGSTWRETNTDIEAQIADTDQAMYKSKQLHYKKLKENPVDPELDTQSFKQTLLRLQSEL